MPATRFKNRNPAMYDTAQTASLRHFNIGTSEAWTAPTKSWDLTAVGVVEIVVIDA